eukprot:gene20393-22405_t
MAKWGKGDPRWIVEERPDSTNVNNWHWTEKNATSWSKDALTDLLKDLKVENDTGKWKIKEVTKVDGEASASNRKAKLFFFYELTIKLEWSGNMKDEFTSHKGYIEVTNLSEENDPEDLDIVVSIKEEKDDHRKMKDFVRKTAIPIVREKCTLYIKMLKEEFSKGMILPIKKNENTNSQSSKVKVENISKTDRIQQVEDKKPTKKEAEKFIKVELKLKEEFKTTAAELYFVLTDEQRVAAFTRSPASLDAKPGGKFSFLSGNIIGEFVEMVPEKKIVQKWRFSNWPEGLYSNVTITLNQKEDCTLLELKQTGIPDTDIERTESGWKRYFWASIKQTFGFGARLF